MTELNADVRDRVRAIMGDYSYDKKPWKDISEDLSKEHENIQKQIKDLVEWDNFLISWLDYGNTRERRRAEEELKGSHQPDRSVVK